MSARRRGARAALRAPVVPLLASLAVAAAAGRAGATLSAEREPDAGGCVDAGSYFPEDQSPEATRARRRCRLENLERAQAAADHDAALAEKQREARSVAVWLESQGISNRVMRRNSVDAFGGAGTASYGLAAGALLRPTLEAEVWIGRATDSASLSGSGGVSNRRNCLGGRGKWLFVEHANVTPFLALGGAGCLATLDAPVYNVSGNGATVGGRGTAHFVTGSIGVAWMEKSGFRLSVEYIFAYAFYTQARLANEPHPNDESLRQAWETQLTTARNGVRLQVGYGF